MKMVFIVHGFGGWPNGGWRPWLMSELDKLEIYACALSMPNSQNPICSEWIQEIERHVEVNKDQEIYLVGHSLGVTAILRYLEKKQTGHSISGAVLISGPIEQTDSEKIIYSFLNKSFDFSTIRFNCQKFSVIHGDNDPVIPLSNGISLSKQLGVELVIVKNGKHFTGSAGWNTLPQCIDALTDIFNTPGNSQ